MTRRLPSVAAAATALPRFIRPGVVGKRVGLAAFAFFLLKGMIWLVIAAGGVLASYL